ncbi:MAG: DUF2974 domain-containing protein, partial [Candidatus Gastranaerophilales bacterium]|nr:DUF2974 domain-containing protein [Candidatus Gastranaerophilales bacterium]
KSKEIIIAYRGTNDIKDWIENDSGLVFDKVPAQLYDALAFYFDVKSNYKDYKITLTGHSLGGSLAQITGAITNEETYTYNAPGVSKLIESMPVKIDLNKPYSNIHNYNIINDPVYKFSVSKNMENLGNTYLLYDSNGKHNSLEIHNNFELLGNGNYYYEYNSKDILGSNKPPVDKNNLYKARLEAVKEQSRLNSSLIQNLNSVLTAMDKYNDLISSYSFNFPVSIFSDNLLFPSNDTINNTVIKDIDDLLYLAKDCGFMNGGTGFNKLIKDFDYDYPDDGYDDYYFPPDNTILDTKADNINDNNIIPLIKKGDYSNENMDDLIKNKKTKTPKLLQLDPNSTEFTRKMSLHQDIDEIMYALILKTTEKLANAHKKSFYDPIGDIYNPLEFNNAIFTKAQFDEIFPDTYIDVEFERNKLKSGDTILLFGRNEENIPAAAYIEKYSDNSTSAYIVTVSAINKKESPANTEDLCKYLAQEFREINNNRSIARTLVKTKKS